MGVVCMHQRQRCARSADAGAQHIPVHLAALVGMPGRVLSVCIVVVAIVECVLYLDSCA